jgi:RNA polymerase sigma-70 factor (ECF subfamily)
VNSGWQHETSASSDWEQWLAQHAPGLLLFARQQTRCVADAQDLVQEAVVECWQRQAQFVPPPLGMVFATIRRRAVDLARSEDRRAVREAVASSDAPQSWFDTSVEERERGRLIQEAMGRLSVIYREVLVLRVWCGLSFAEIAAALQIPQNTAASRYRYGLEELRRQTREVFA